MFTLKYCKFEVHVKFSHENKKLILRHAPSVKVKYDHGNRVASYRIIGTCNKSS